MADNWDDILAEPIASIGDPRAAAPSDGDSDIGETPGGWLAVASIAAISPRPQDAPVTMPDPSDMLQLKLTLQSETPQASAKLPPSLADQLSLTWAARRRHAAVEAEPEVEPAPASRSAPRRTEAPAPPEPAKPAAAWRKPLEAVARVFNRQPRPEPQAAPPAVEAPGPPAARPEPRTVLAIAEPAVLDEAPATRAAPPDVPLTLATPQRRNDTPEATPDVIETPRRQLDAPAQPVAPAAPLDVPLAQTPVVRAARLDAAAAPEAPAQRNDDAPAPEATAPAAETQAPPSLAPRRGLLAWLLPRRAPETPQAPQATARPATAPAAHASSPAPIGFESRPTAPVQHLEAPSQRATPDATAAPAEPTLAQALPTLRNTATQYEADGPTEPELTPGVLLQDMPPEVALTHLLRGAPNDAPDGADAETVRETLSRMVDAAPVTEPAHIDTAEDHGETLPAVLMQRMEGLLDVPLHEVRIFRGQVSQRLAERMQADAVTIGNQVHVAPGQGDPSLPSGRALLAHEVTHYAVHRVESEGAAATISGPDASGAPAWPQFTGIAPEPGTPSQEAEETLALRIEHAMSRPDAFDPPSPGMPAPAASPLSLQHRAPPPQIVVAPGGLPGAPFGGDAVGFGGFGGFRGSAFGGPGGRTMGSFGGGAMSNGGGVGMAPWDRIVSGAEDAMSSASDIGGQAAGMAQEAQEAAEDFEDNDEMIEKVAEAVIKHMQDKDKFERERRGAFDGNIGG